MGSIPQIKPKPSNEAMSVFLHALFDAKPEWARILIWTLQSRYSRSFTTIDDALAYAQKSVEIKDLYYGVCSGDHDLEPSERWKQTEIRVVPGVWADVDVSHGVHKKADHLPQTFEAAYALIYEIGLRPTLIVNSGHGYQALWLFDKPYVIGAGDKTAWQRIHTLTSRWMQGFKAISAGHGWAIDSVQDLSRVLRLPGSLNLKEPEDVLPVTIVEHSPDQRYNLDEIEAHLDAQKEIFTLATLRGADFDSKQRAIRSTLSYDAKAMPPLDKFLKLTDPRKHTIKAMKERAKKANETWEGERTDLADPSPNGWDMAMAIFAVLSPDDWTDQEITDLLIARRRHREEKPKTNRTDYYARTIATAREWCKDEKERQANGLKVVDLNSALLALINKAMTGGAVGGEVADEGATTATGPATDAPSTPLALVKSEVEVEEAEEVEPEPEVEVEEAEEVESEVDGEDDDDDGADYSMYAAILGGSAEDEDEIAKARERTKAAASSAAAKSTAKVGEEGKEGKERKSRFEPSGMPPVQIDEIAEMDDAERITTLREQQLEMLSKHVHPSMRWLKVTKLLSTPPQFVLTLQSGARVEEIQVGDASGVMDIKKFRNFIGNYLGLVIEMRSMKDWDNIAQAILACAIEESIGEESTDRGLMKEWLRQYLASGDVQRRWEGAPSPDRPFLKDDNIYIFVSSFSNFLRFGPPTQRVETRGICTLLRASGCNPRTVSVVLNGRRSTKQAWELPGAISKEFIEPPKVFATFEEEA